MRFLRPITFAPAPYAAAIRQAHRRGAPATHSRALAIQSLARASGTHRHLLRADRAGQVMFRRKQTLLLSPRPLETPRRYEKIGPLTGHRVTRREAMRAR